MVGAAVVSTGGRYPVTKVSQTEALAYVAWLSAKTGERYRLLSESEWEYVARAGTTTRYWWGDEYDPDYSNAHLSDDSPLEVGSYPVNPFGLYDVIGNEGEMVADCWNGSYVGAPADGSVWDSGLCTSGVVRSGEVSGRGVHARRNLTIHLDIDQDPNTDLRTYRRYGFRVAREL